MVVSNIYIPVNFTTDISRATPLFTTSISAGFPSPADDYIDKRLDLNEFLIRHPSATFFVRVEGDSMIGAGIHHGDILVVDRALEVTDRKIVIAVIEGELTVKRYRNRGGNITLEPENREYDPIIIDNVMDFNIWGVVTSVIHYPN